jgi:hypothetical protein
MYLKLENAIKCAPSEQFLHNLGLSASRGQNRKIGKFGSGFKQAIALLARENLLERCRLCIGVDSFSYLIEGENLRDAEGNRYYNEKILTKKQNGGKKDLNISTRFGSLDWNNLSMALRELFANFLDGAEGYDGTYSTFKAECVSNEGERDCRRAKDGFMRFYIPLTQSVMEYMANLSINFICKNPDYDLNKGILPSNNENIKLYVKGVLVGNFENKSLFHYNLPFELDESRNVQINEARATCAQALASQATVEEAKLFIEKIILDGEEYYWESQFSSWEMADISGDNKNTWKQAFIEVFGNNAVVCKSVHHKEMVETKGYTAILPKDEYFARQIAKLDIPTPAEILNYHDLNGREIVPTNENTIKFFNFVWNELARFNMTGGKEKPALQTYVQLTMSDGAALGFYQDGCVYIRKDYENDAGMFILKVLIEECGHYASMAQDCTRDFQDFAFRLAANYAFEKFSGN